MTRAPKGPRQTSEDDNLTKIKIEKGEYECPKCKKFTVIGRSKKAAEPLTCCETEMVKVEKAKFTEPPAAKAKTKAKAASKKKKKKATAKRKRKKKKEPIQELPLTPGAYRCPTCGLNHELQPTDDRDKHLRCSVCYVKMMRVG